MIRILFQEVIVLIRREENFYSNSPQGYAKIDPADNRTTKTTNETDWKKKTEATYNIFCLPSNKGIR